MKDVFRRIFVLAFALLAGTACSSKDNEDTHSAQGQLVREDFKEAKGDTAHEPTGDEVKSAIEARLTADDAAYFAVKSVDVLGKKCRADGCTVQVNTTFTTRKQALSWITLPNSFVQRDGAFPAGETFTQENTLDLIYFDESKSWRVRPPATR